MWEQFQEAIELALLYKAIFTAGSQGDHKAVEILAREIQRRISLST